MFGFNGNSGYDFSEPAFSDSSRKDGYDWPKPPPRPSPSQMVNFGRKDGYAAPKPNTN